MKYQVIIAGFGTAGAIAAIAAPDEAPKYSCSNVIPALAECRQAALSSDTTCSNQWG